MRQIMKLMTAMDPIGTGISKETRTFASSEHFVWNIDEMK
jgi:hypothetical protein